MVAVVSEDCCVDDDLNVDLAGRSMPRARSFTPSLGLWMHFDCASSRTVMGFVGSMRPWSIHSWIRSRLAGARSRAKL